MLPVIGVRSVLTWLSNLPFSSMGLKCIKIEANVYLSNRVRVLSNTSFHAAEQNGCGASRSTSSLRNVMENGWKLHDLYR